jgi:TRAP-type transport system periplasmic protein
VKPLIEKFSADVGADTVSLLFKELDAVRKK